MEWVLVVLIFSNGTPNVSYVDEFATLTMCQAAADSIVTGGVAPGQPTTYLRPVCIQRK